MKIHEVERLLALIVATDRRPFPDGAETAWWAVLKDEESADVMQAFTEISRQAEPPAGGYRPGILRTRAAALREARNRTIGEIAPVVHAEPSEAYKAFRQELARTAARLGNLDRAPAVKADTSSPFVDGEQQAAMEQERARQLAALDLIRTAA